jgi:hypothetical protein
MSALFGFRASWLVSFAPANGSNTITNCTQNSKLQNPLFKIKKKLLNFYNRVMKNTITISHSLKHFINNLNKKPYKPHDFPTLIDEIKNNYTHISKKSEEFFIKNIAHTFNTKTNALLFDLKNNDISKNYTSKVNYNNLEELNRLTKVYHHTKERNTLTHKLLENEIIQLNNELEIYTHMNNTDFIEKMDSKYAFKKLAKVKYLDYKNRDKTPVMLTMTVDREFRKYIKVKECILGSSESITSLKEVSKEANLTELIEKSYHKLNHTFREFYSHYKTLNKRSGDTDKLDYILIFEPHKSLAFHLHILFYCNDTQEQNLHHCWKNYLNNLTDKQKKGQDIKIIDTSIAKGSTYLSKYLIKEYNNDENKEGSNFFNQYKRYFSKFKVFRTSNFYHSTQAKIDKMYSYLCANYPDILEKIRLSDTPIYEILEQFEIKELFIFEKEKIKSITYDRKLIQEFYDFYKDTHEDYQIKEEISNNIDYFKKSSTLSRIKNATFEYKHHTLIDIFTQYNIDISDIEEEEIDKDEFYEVGMYEIEEIHLNKAITLANNNA